MWSLAYLKKNIYIYTHIFFNIDQMDVKTFAFIILALFSGLYCLILNIAVNDAQQW